MRRFRVPAIPAPRTRQTLDEPSSHHLLHVLRGQPGQTILVFDGTGNQAPAVLVEVIDTLAVIEITGPVSLARPSHDLHLVIGLPKGPAMDRAVRMATEAGVTAIHPVIAKRSTARGDRGARWRRIVTTAAQQCGRADVPTVHPLELLGDALQRLPDDTRIAVVGAARCEPANGAAAILIGPEGGWSDAEIRDARSAGAQPVGLGAWTLRSDTAAAIAIATLSRNN